MNQHTHKKKKLLILINRVEKYGAPNGTWWRKLIWDRRKTYHKHHDISFIHKYSYNDEFINIIKVLISWGHFTTWTNLASSWKGQIIWHLIKNLTLTHSHEGLQEHYYRAILAANLPYKISSINRKINLYYYHYYPDCYVNVYITTIF